MVKSVKADTNRPSQSAAYKAGIACEINTCLVEVVLAISRYSYLT